MAICMQDLGRAEPSSDFPTEDDVEPCPCRGLSRGRMLTCAAGCALAVWVIGFLVGRALGRRTGALG
jgi:hypothetical protein